MACRPYGKNPPPLIVSMGKKKENECIYVLETEKTWCMQEAVSRVATGDYFFNAITINFSKQK